MGHGSQPCLQRVTHDFGDGARLYAGKANGRRLASWDGMSWTTLGADFDGSVLALASWNDGPGPALFVGGSHNVIPEGPARRPTWDRSRNDREARIGIGKLDAQPELELQPVREEVVVSHFERVFADAAGDRHPISAPRSADDAAGVFTWGRGHAVGSLAHAWRAKLDARR